MLILCSPTSIRRPWINFEAGAAWMRKIPLIPMCHAGLTPSDLPAPLSFRHGLLLTEPRGLRRLYQRVARELSCAIPAPPFEAVAVALSRTRQALKPSEREVDLLDRDRGIKRRLDEALRHEGFKWRSLASVASAAGIPEDVAADHLRGGHESRVQQGQVRQCHSGPSVPRAMRMWVFKMPPIPRLQPTAASASMCCRG